MTLIPRFNKLTLDRPYCVYSGLFPLRGGDEMNDYERALNGLLAPKALKDYIETLRRNRSDLRASAIDMDRAIDALDRVYAQRVVTK